MNVPSITGGVLMAQAGNMMSTNTAMLKMSAESERAVATMLQEMAGQAQAPSQAVTPVEASGKGAAVDVVA